MEDRYGRKRRKRKVGILWELAAFALAGIGLVSILMGQPEMAQESTQKNKGYIFQESISEKDVESSEQAGADAEAAILEVHFIDVGQADATLIKCDGAAMLIDAGEESQGTALQLYLKKQGVEELDYLILTHPDADHIGGAGVILTKFEVDTVFMTDYPKENRIYEKLLDTLEYERLEWIQPAVGDTYTLEDASFQIMAPNGTYEDPNNSSIALRLVHGDNSFLFTGDAGQQAERDILDNGMDITADVYKVGHHGSGDSSGSEFLDMVAPRYAVISCGKDNAYGHPHAEVLEALKERQIEIYRTDEQGNIVALSNGVEITWRTEVTKESDAVD